MNNLLRDRRNKRRQIYDEEPSLETHDQIKNESQILKKSQIQLNKDIKIVEQQIKDLNLNFNDPTEKINVKSISLKDRFFNIQQKKQNLNLAEEKPIEHFKHHSDLSSQCQNLISELKMQKSKLKGIKANKSLEKSTLETNLHNRVKIQKNLNSCTRHLALKLVLLEEKVDKFKRLEECYNTMLKSLEDVLQKINQEKDIMVDYEDIYYKSEFVSSEFNELRLKSKYLYEKLFKDTLMSSKVIEEEKAYIYEKKVEDCINRFEKD